MVAAIRQRRPRCLPLRDEPRGERPLALELHHLHLVLDLLLGLHDLVAHLTRRPFGVCAGGSAEAAAVIWLLGVAIGLGVVAIVTRVTMLLLLLLLLLLLTARHQLLLLLPALAVQPTTTTRKATTAKATTTTAGIASTVAAATAPATIPLWRRILRRAVH